MDEDRGLIRAAGSVGVMTALSRVGGYVRDLLQAALLGATNSSDAFVIAFRIPNMLRRLLAEGAMTSAFVPAFTHHMRHQDRAAMWRFAGSVLYALTALLAGIVVLGVVFSPLLVKVLAWGFTDTPEKLALTISLNRWMFPYILLISLAALASGILNAFERFMLPAFTPVLLNISIISCALLLKGRFPDPAYAFACGVLLGGLAQLAVQIPPLLRHGLDLRPPRPFDLAGVREVGRLMLPRVFGAGITQLNLVVDSQFAASLRPGSVSFLYYAVRLTELTLGVFGISLSTVILPRLSRAAAEGDRLEVVQTLSMATRLLIFVTIPATVGLILLRRPIIHTLFEHQRFIAEDTLLTAGALLFYSLGILPFASINVLAAAFYAHRDTRTPVQIGAVTFVLHLVLNFILREPLAHRGIALSTSISALVNAALLAWVLSGRFGRFLDDRVRGAFARTLIATALMAGVLELALLWELEFTQLTSILLKGTALVTLIGVGAAVYLGTSVALRSGEVHLIFTSFAGRGRR